VDGSTSGLPRQEVPVEPGRDVTAIALFAPTFFLVYVVLYRGSANVVGMLISISVQSERMCRSRLDGDRNAMNKLKKERISILIAINFLLQPHGTCATLPSTVHDTLVSVQRRPGYRP
jgi:hypothetical protein